MRALWQTAVAVQLDDVVCLKREALAGGEAVRAARAEAELRVEPLGVASDNGGFCTLSDHEPAGRQLPRDEPDS